MKRIVISFLALLVAVTSAEAKSWKIGPNSVNGMDFTDINAAMASSSVAAGDTLYLDQYFSTSVKQSVTKRVVIIGTGYDTSFTDEKVVATLTDSLTLMVDSIQVKSVKLASVKIYANECTLDRCYTGTIQIGKVPNGLNHIYSCYIIGTVGNQVLASSTITSVSGSTTNTYVNAQFDIQNCLFNSSGYHVRYLTNSIINNNTFVNNANSYCVYYVDNSQITNNIIHNKYYNGYYYGIASNCLETGSGNTIEHNIAYQNISSSNSYNSSIAQLFVSTGNYSDYYKLKTNVTDNYALTYGTDGGEVGCHGGMFGCPSGGRPQYIPYFTKVVVGQRTENGTLPVSVEVKIQDE